MYQKQVFHTSNPAISSIKSTFSTLIAPFPFVVRNFCRIFAEKSYGISYGVNDISCVVYDIIYDLQGISYAVRMQMATRTLISLDFII